MYSRYNIVKRKAGEIFSRSKVINWMKRGVSTITELSKRTGMAKSTIWNHANNARKIGIVEKDAINMRTVFYYVKSFRGIIMDKLQRRLFEFIPNEIRINKCVST